MRDLDGLAAAPRCGVHSAHRRRAAMRLLAAALLPCVALAQEPIAGSGRIDGAYCPLAARLVLDDGRAFEFAAEGQPAARWVEVAAGRIEGSLCGRAPRLVARITAAVPQPEVEVGFAASEWPARAAEVDALARRHRRARFVLRVLGADAADGANTAQRIALQLLERNPALLARSRIEAGDGAPGWRVRVGDRSQHAIAADGVDRLLAVAR